jgi:hypothetical protein
MNESEIEEEGNDEGKGDADDDYGDESPPALIVKQSNIPNGGQGLFLASRFVAAGAIIVQEEAIAIRRPAAKKIMNMPAWRGLQPVIQGSANRFLDIRLLKIYKANHCEATSSNCNSYVSQNGPARLTMTAVRNIWRGEEILWEYSQSMQEFSS